MAERIYDALSPPQFFDGETDSWIEYQRQEQIDELLYLLRFALWFGKIASTVTRKRGRQREWLVDDLIRQIGIWYRESTGIVPPKSMTSGPFVDVVEDLVAAVFPSREYRRIGDLVRNSHRRFGRR